MSRSTRQSREETGIDAKSKKRADADKKKDNVCHQDSPEDDVSGEN
jgi:hypothetical protein